jgi:hypothetical protein
MQGGDTLSKSLVRIDLQGELLNRVGLAGQVVGALGIAVWGFYTFLAVDASSHANVAPGEWKARALQILSPVTILLFAMLVIALGSVCRLLASWSSVHLSSTYLDDGGPDADRAGSLIDEHS